MVVTHHDHDLRSRDTARLRTVQRPTPLRPNKHSSSRRLPVTASHSARRPVEVPTVASSGSDGCGAISKDVSTLPDFLLILKSLVANDADTDVDAETTPPTAGAGRSAHRLSTSVSRRHSGFATMVGVCAHERGVNGTHTHAHTHAHRHAHRRQDQNQSHQRRHVSTRSRSAS